MNGATRRLVGEPAQRQRRMDHGDDRIAAPQRDQHVADRKASAPHRIDHRMIGVRGGIGGRDCRIGTEVPGQIERQLHARRKLGKTLVDAEFEIERAILMPQHDRRRDRRIAGRKLTISH